LSRSRRQRRGSRNRRSRWSRRSRRIWGHGSEKRIGKEVKE